MKLRLSVVAPIVFALLQAAAAHAQVGLYLNPVAMRISNSTADHGLFAFLGDGNTSQMFYGEAFGAYYDFKTPYTFKAGVDVRDSNLHGNSAMINNFTVGLRVSGHPFGNNWKPYVEPFVGAGTTRAPRTAIRVTKLAYGVMGGLDYETRHHIDLRAVEIGYGSVTTASSETIGASATIPAASFLSVSAGLVFRFP